MILDDGVFVNVSFASEDSFLTPPDFRGFCGENGRVRRESILLSVESEVAMDGKHAASSHRTKRSFSLEDTGPR